MSPAFPDLVDVVVEIPRGSRNKYEYDEADGVMRFDRRLLGAVGFPADYGFVADTIGTDGDPLDALVLLDEPTFPGIRVRSRPIGVTWIDGAQGREAKLLCVPQGEPAYDGVRDLADLPPHLSDEISHFFTVYTGLDEGPQINSEGQEGRAAALRVLEESRERWRGQRSQGCDRSRPAGP